MACLICFTIIQVLVYHDLLGMLQHPHHAKVCSNLACSVFVTLLIHETFYSRRKHLTFLQVTPKFCKQYARVGDVINGALLEYKKEVTQGSFPGPTHTPYKINSAYVDEFSNELQKLGLKTAALAAAEAAEKINISESPSEGSPTSE